MCRNEAADKVPPGPQHSLQPSRRHGILSSSSPSQSSFSTNSAGSQYSWHPPETQREKSHRDQLPPFLETGTTMITTAESLRTFHRSAAQQGSQEGSEQAFIPSLMKQHLCTIKKGFPFVWVSGLEHSKVCLHFCWFFKQFLQKEVL